MYDSPLINQPNINSNQQFNPQENMNQQNQPNMGMLNVGYNQENAAPVPQRINANLVEKIIDPVSGWCMIVVCVLLMLGGIGGIVLCSVYSNPTGEVDPWGHERYSYPLLPLLEIPILMIIISIILLCSGFIINPPNTASILMFCGKYKGTIKKNGMFFVNPFYTLQKLSLKSETFNSPIVKVNDKIGNPINVGCVIMWRVADCNKALFDVENYRTFISNQCETSIRQVGCMFAYDKVGEDDVSLRSGNEIVHQTLKNELAKRLLRAGILVEDATISEISYSTEISSAMLKRQAAEALILGRDRIVRGAVDTVSQCVLELQTKNICKMKDENRSRMVSNLMVVLCSDSQVHPVVNTGAS
ncbi:MAG: SPFH domain-containing protein [archaeon]|nr:SPFH domain-containing protein [archaeon]